MDAVIQATSERPWLWIVIILVIVLPILLIVVYCCRNPGPSKTAELERLTREMHKKDDDIVEEDDEDESGKPEAGDGVQEESREDLLLDSKNEGARGDETTTKADLESDSENDSPSKVKGALAFID